MTLKSKSREYLSGTTLKGSIETCQSALDAACVTMMKLTIFCNSIFQSSSSHRHRMEIAHNVPVIDFYNTLIAMKMLYLLCVSDPRFIHPESCAIIFISRPSNDISHHPLSFQHCHVFICTNPSARLMSRLMIPPLLLCCVEKYSVIYHMILFSNLVSSWGSISTFSKVNGRR